MYVVAGSLGLASTNKRTKGLYNSLIDSTICAVNDQVSNIFECYRFIGTVVMSSIALAASIVASVLSGMNAGVGFYYCYYNYDACNKNSPESYIK